MYTFNIVFRPEPEGGYTVYVPSLPGCISYGATLEEAQEMIEEAMALYLETVKEEKAEVIDDSKTFMKTVSYA